MSESKSEKLSSLKPQRQNANLHTERGLDLLGKSIQENGWIGAITVAADGETFDGSARIEVGVDCGFEDAIIVDSDGSRPVVVRRTDIPNADDPRAVELGLAANRIASVDLAWDVNVLAAMKSEGIATEKLWTEKEWKLLVPETPGSADADVSLDRAAELQEKWQVSQGEIIQIGRHRLMCGDSVSKADVAALMLSDHAGMIFTDPPYNVDVAGGSHDPTDIANYRSGGTIANDKVSDAEFHRFLVASLNNAFAVAAPGAPIYVCFSDSELENFITTFKQSGFYYSGLIIWRKQQFVFGRKDYHSQHEPMLYGWKLGSAHYFCDDHTQSTVWDIDRPMRSDKEHPTQKPTELAARAIRNSSLPSGIVYDPFVGSGTTIVAAENLNRTCYAMEISPEYCAVVLERMSTAFPSIVIKREKAAA